MTRGDLIQAIYEWALAMPGGLDHDTRAAWAGALCAIYLRPGTWGVA